MSDAAVGRFHLKLLQKTDTAARIGTVLTFNTNSDIFVGGHTSVVEPEPPFLTGAGKKRRFQPQLLLPVISRRRKIN